MLSELRIILQAVVIGSGAAGVLALMLCYWSVK